MAIDGERIKTRRKERFARKGERRPRSHRSSVKERSLQFPSEEGTCRLAPLAGDLQ